MVYRNHIDPLSVRTFVCVIMSGPYISHGGTLGVFTAHKIFLSEDWYWFWQRSFNKSKVTVRKSAKIVYSLYHFYGKALEVLNTNITYHLMVCNDFDTWSKAIWAHSTSLEKKVQNWCSVFIFVLEKYWKFLISQVCGKKVHNLCQPYTFLIEKD